MSILVRDFPYKRGIRRHLNDNGITFDNKDGVVTFSDETLALQLIASYNPLPTVKQEARQRVIIEAAIRVNVIYPHIDAESEDVLSFYNYTMDMYSGGLPLPDRLQQFKSIVDTTKAKIVEINNMNDHALIELYDAAIGW